MNDIIRKLLSPRIEKNCLPLYEDGHFKHAARDSMVQVEMALKEKGKVQDIQFGKQLINSLFAGKHEVKLRVPIGEDLQEYAKQYFNGVFAYYRNYTAHDGSKIDEKIALRILIIASELLDLIDASNLTLTDKGGVAGLVRVGGFETVERLGRILTLLNDYHMHEDTYDGLFEDLAENGFTENDLNSVFMLDLVVMHSTEIEMPLDPTEEVLDWFELTDLGREALKSIEAQESSSK